MTSSRPRIRYVTIDSMDAEATAAFWSAALGYDVISTEPYVLLKDPADSGPHLHVQRSAEPAASGLHLDLFSTDRAAERRRLEGLGATTVRTVSEHEMEWDVLQAPDGRLFCLFDEA